MIKVNNQNNFRYKKTPSSTKDSIIGKKRTRNEFNDNKNQYDFNTDQNNNILDKNIVNITKKRRKRRLNNSSQSVIYNNLTLKNLNSGSLSIKSIKSLNAKQNHH